MNRKSKWPAIVLLLLIVITAYPLSTGPAEMIAAWMQSSRVNDAVYRIYEPLKLLPAPLMTPIGQWMNMWRRWALEHPPASVHAAQPWPS